MTIQRSICSEHPFVAPAGVTRPDDPGRLWFTCEETDHRPTAGPLSWSVGAGAFDAHQEEAFIRQYGLTRGLPAIVASFGPYYIEHGLIERAYALAHPVTFSDIVTRFGHSAAGSREDFTASVLIARALGQLARNDGPLHRLDEHGTGRWSTHSTSWYATYPLPAPDARLTWKAGGHDMSYVTGGS